MHKNRPSGRADRQFVDPGHLAFPFLIRSQSGWADAHEVRVTPDRVTHSEVDLVVPEKGARCGHFL